MVNDIPEIKMITEDLSPRYDNIDYKEFMHGNPDHNVDVIIHTTMGGAYVTVRIDGREIVTDHEYMSTENILEDNPDYNNALFHVIKVPSEIPNMVSIIFPNDDRLDSIIQEHIHDNPDQTSCDENIYNPYLSQINKFKAFVVAFRDRLALDHFTETEQDAIKFMIENYDSHVGDHILDPLAGFKSNDAKQEYSDKYSDTVRNIFDNHFNMEFKYNFDRLTKFIKQYTMTSVTSKDKLDHKGIETDMCSNRLPAETVYYKFGNIDNVWIETSIIPE